MIITVILTCFNRKEKTVNCMKSLSEGNLDFDLRFIVVDDNSTDGTPDAIQELGYTTKVINGNGCLFWSGGMRTGIDYFISHSQDTDYVLLVNDDVDFYENIIKKMVIRSQKNQDAVIVGSTCDANGEYSYGALKLYNTRNKNIYYHVEIKDYKKKCDTFNCNCVLIKKEILLSVGNFDKVYTHALADLDYGLTLSKKGYPIYTLESYVGVCDKNSSKNTWKDTSLSRMERFRKKESPKGAPFKEWFHYLNKNFGLPKAILFSVSPYIKIFFNK